MMTDFLLIDPNSRWLLFSCFVSFSNSQFRILAILLPQLESFFISWSTVSEEAISSKGIVYQSLFLSIHQFALLLLQTNNQSSIRTKGDIDWAYAMIYKNTLF